MKSEPFDDPLEDLKKVMTRFNSGNWHRHARKLTRVKWWLLNEEGCQERNREHFMGLLIKKLRKMFKKEIQKDASLTWIGKGWIEDGRDDTIKLSFHYEIHYRGLKVERTFFPRISEDMIIEATLIWGVLNHWNSETYPNKIEGANFVKRNDLPTERRR